MNKNVIYGLIVGAVVAVGGFYFFTRSSKHVGSFKDNASVKSAEADSSQTKEFQDPAGFKFSYPKDYVVSSEAPNDPNIYSSLTITSKKNKGQISILILQSTLSSLTAYFKQSGLGTSSTTSADLKLGDLSAKQLDDGVNVTTAALDSNILYVVKLSPEENKTEWLDAYQKIVSSLTFQAPTSPAAGAAAVGSDVGPDIQEETIQ